MLGISMVRETEWGWFTAKEMAEVELTPEGREELQKMWDGVLQAAKAHGGLEAYGKHLLKEQEAADAEFKNIIQLAVPSLNSDYSWYIQGAELIGADDYGNQSIILSFREIRKQLEKGLTIAALVDKEVADVSSYWEE